MTWSWRLVRSIRAKVEALVTPARSDERYFDAPHDGEVSVTCAYCGETLRASYQQQRTVDVIRELSKVLPHKPGFACWNPARPWRWPDENPPIFERMNHDI